MNEKIPREEELEARVRDLEAEVARLRACGFGPADGPAVAVPPELREVFAFAEETVGAYFQTFRADPTEGTVEIAGERYLLIRASALSHGFLSAISELYDDRGDVEALHIGKTLLFDMAHVIGIHDARNFHEKMGLTDPVAKLSAGPVHFSYTGWAFVELLPGCRPTPDDDFFLTYRHPYSFESDAWLRAGEKTDYTVCVMNAGYSAGWCEESFGISLAAAEISCKARGDEHCEFVMAPPHRLREHVERALSSATEEERRRAIYDIPTLFERKHVEERLHAALARAEAANASQRLFLANVSHEIRTPLTGILGMTNVLLKKPLDREQRQDIETIHQSGQVLLDILNDILRIRARAQDSVTEAEQLFSLGLKDDIGICFQSFSARNSTE